MKNTLICRMPSPLPSMILTKPTFDHFCTHSRALASAIDPPMMPVARFGSRIDSLVKVASAGAVKYSRKMKISDQPTDWRAAFTDGVVK